jgi:PAS domain-containing protein
MVRSDARILVSTDSRILEATPAALELLGLTFDQLQALPPGGLSLEQDAAASAEFAAAWEGGGRPPLVGSTTVRLPDGSLARVRYYIWSREDGKVEVVLEGSSEPVAQAPRAYTIGKVLSAWRAVERRLETLDPGSEEWQAADAENRYFRSEYRRLSNQV